MIKYSYATDKAGHAPSTGIIAGKQAPRLSAHSCSVARSMPLTGIYSTCARWFAPLAVVLALGWLSGCSEGGCGSAAAQIPCHEQESGISASEADTGTHLFGGETLALYGQYCDYSGREIRSRRYGAIAVLVDGAELRFNSTETLIRYLNEQAIGNERIARLGVVDFISADRLMAPEDLLFHRSRLLPSPGGGFVSAMDPGADEGLLYNIRQAYPGTQYSWEQVREMVLAVNAHPSIHP